jgi:OmcA/MtrC family decaheme c-type cytochrome
MRVCVAYFKTEQECQVNLMRDSPHLLTDGTMPMSSRHKKVESMKKRLLIILGTFFGLATLMLVAACSSAIPSPSPTTPQPPVVQATVAPLIAPGPGMKMEITKVEVGADSKPIVTFKVTDDGGNLIGSSNWDAGSLRFTIAKIVTDKDTFLSRYENYITGDVKGQAYTYKGETKQPALATAKQVLSAADATGKLTESASFFTYVFTNTLPADFDKSATHVVGGSVTRNNREFVGNSTFSLVPAGGTPTTRQVVDTSACNGCHDTLAAHGGQRREVGLCVLCHTDQNTDPESGNVVDFKVMVHKLHNGSNLPSVALGKKPYYIVGFSQSVTDFTASNWPQDIRNCTTCHQKGAQADNWKNAPSRAACGSCHDAIDWTTGKSKFTGGRDHPAGPQNDDKACKGCHAADSGQEFDASIVGAHTIPTRSKQLKGIVYSIDGANLKPGEKPSVDFTIKDNSGATVDANTMTSLEITIANPVPDYAARITDSANRVVAPPAAPFVRTGTLSDLGGGKFRYTFAAPLDPTWKGTAAVGMAGYRNATIKGNFGKDNVVREGNLNPVIYVALDGAKPAAPRIIVKRDNCNQCHLDLGNPAGLAVHGGTRRSPEYCVLCHNANQTDEPGRPKEQFPPETVHWDYMIHSIHTGKERDVPAQFSNLHTDNIGYPTAGDQKNCTKCHAGRTFTLPLASTALPTTITQGTQVIKTIQPIAAACTGCHASKQDVAHTQVMTDKNNLETCVVCHATGREFAVDAVHKR